MHPLAFGNNQAHKTSINLHHFVSVQFPRAAPAGMSWNRSQFVAHDANGNYDAQFRITMFAMLPVFRLLFYGELYCAFSKKNTHTCAHTTRSDRCTFFHQNFLTSTSFGGFPVVTTKSIKFQFALTPRKKNPSAMGFSVEKEDWKGTL